MSKADRLKEEIGWLKIPFGLLIVVDASLLGWLAQSFSTVSPVLVFAGGAGFIAVTSVVIWANRTAQHLLAELEDV